MIIKVMLPACSYKTQVCVALSKRGVAAMVATLMPFWRPTTCRIIVLTVWLIIVTGNTAVRAREPRDITEYLFTAYTRTCRAIMKTYSGGEGRYDETRKLKVIFYGPSDIGPTFSINEAIEQINQTSLFTDRNMSVITIHGFNDHAVSDTPLDIAKAYHDKGNYNVILLDSSDLTSGNYMRAAYMTELIGRKLAFFILQLGIDPKKTHLVGISLGAQIAGWTGRFYKSHTGKTFHRITGLDPAGPCFTYAGENERLSRNDADFVDVIHTNRGIQGVMENVGHVDFFVNGGGPNQPGCDGMHCSHSRAVMYFVESFNDTKPFIARKCDSWQSFNEDACNNNRLCEMGYNTPISAKGNYYLRTASSEPFSLGEQGASPKALKKIRRRESFYWYFPRPRHSI